MHTIFILTLVCLLYKYTVVLIFELCHLLEHAAYCSEFLCFLWQDWWITVGCFVSLLLASIVFAATMDITVLARTSVVFGFLASVAFGVDLFFMRRPFVKKPSVNGTTGGAEGQPLNNPVQVQGNANETV
ncbi:hypothetical protein FKM82_020070 [Ascaphus truei]